MIFLLLLMLLELKVRFLAEVRFVELLFLVGLRVTNSCMFNVLMFKGIAGGRNPRLIDLEGLSWLVCVHRAQISVLGNDTVLDIWLSDGWWNYYVWCLILKPLILMVMVDNSSDHLQIFYHLIFLSRLLYPFRFLIFICSRCLDGNELRERFGKGRRSRTDCHCFLHLKNFARRYNSHTVFYQIIVFLCFFTRYIVLIWLLLIELMPHIKTLCFLI